MKLLIISIVQTNDSLWERDLSITEYESAVVITCTDTADAMDFELDPEVHVHTV